MRSPTLTKPNSQIHSITTKNIHAITTGTKKVSEVSYERAITSKRVGKVSYGRANRSKLWLIILL